MASSTEEIGKSLKVVLERVQRAADTRPKNLPQLPVRLVAVSKTKPVTDIIAAYKNGHRHFGENYVQELEEKARNDLILEQCKDIKWHFIGHLQRNKSNKVAVLPNLHMVETVDTQKLAQTLNNNWEKYKRPGELYVMVQVNTSQEDAKSGCNASEMVSLVTFIRNKCPRLHFSGLMTIGAYGYDPATGPNPDFLKLVEYRETVCQALNIPAEEVELSMGMSTDFEHAIHLGSSNVRVGSTIFGSRNVPLVKDLPSASNQSPGETSGAGQSDAATSSSQGTNHRAETGTQSTEGSAGPSNSIQEINSSEATNGLENLTIKP